MRHELVMLPNLTLWDNLAYKVEGYKVTLLGQVRNASLKSEAENSVKRIEGVEQWTIGQILPPSPSDDRIRPPLRGLFRRAGLGSRMPWIGAADPHHRAGWQRNPGRRGEQRS